MMVVGVMVVLTSIGPNRVTLRVVVATTAYRAHPLALPQHR